MAAEKPVAEPDDDLTRIVPSPLRKRAESIEPAASTLDETDERTRIVRPIDLRDEATRVIASPPAPLQPPDTPDDQRTRVVPRASPVASAISDDATNVSTTFATLAPMQSHQDTMLGLAGSDEQAAAKQVGRYLILEKLGRGGMATVFKAHDPGIGRDVAIKFLHATLCEDEEYRGRFLREARAAGGLSHPNIVTVHDVGEINGRPYMAMELLRGQPLAELLSGGKPMPLRDVVIIGIQLARALDYAHARKIVHRDIKPGNIALLEGTNTIKVMDFGIAHMDSGGPAEQHTRVGDVLGTPQYMSPEQTRGEKLDGRSDLFSVGIMLYQMLSGQRPFQAGSMVAVAMKIAQEQPPPLDKLRPEIPASLRRIVDRCLAKAPDQRFQTGQELSAALGRVLAQLDEAQRARERPRIVPLRVKWAMTMALIVAIVMSLVAAVVSEKQQTALRQQVSDNGAALARFLAAQNAEEALAERWEGILARVQTMMKTGDFKSIVVIDKTGVVRASGNADEVDQAYRPPQSEVIQRRGDGIVLTRFAVDDEPILGVEAPILFNTTLEGHVVLGLREAPLLSVARLSLLLMGVLVLVTVIAVAVAMYFVADWFARPIKTVSEGLDEIARGHLDHRIADTRKDEFGLLFKAFDRMAQALQDARVGLSPATIAPPPTVAEKSETPHPADTR